jgi:hypothetical protein
MASCSSAGVSRIFRVHGLRNKTLERPFFSNSPLRMSFDSVLKAVMRFFSSGTIDPSSRAKKSATSAKLIHSRARRWRLVNLSIRDFRHTSSRLFNVSSIARTRIYAPRRAGKPKVRFGLSAGGLSPRFAIMTDRQMFADGLRELSPSFAVSRGRAYARFRIPE